MNQNEIWDDFYRKNPRPWRGNNKIPLDGPCRALDIGCGNGKTISTLLNAGCTVSGVDFSSVAIESCERNYGQSCTLVVSDATDIPFEDGSFDLVTLVHILENLDDVQTGKVADEVGRLLVPGGKVFVRTFSKDDMRTGKKETGQIAYHPREPCDIIELFGSFSCEYCERIETTTRFGQSRSRTEGLFVRR